MNAPLGAESLPKVQVSTQLIVGGNDGIVIEMQKEASSALRCKTRLDIIPGATHLFEEPGTLDQVVALAADWFEKHLRVAGEEQ